ncbi:MAG: serine/threonine-protein kinase PknK, partial [Anaerolineae bacterium]|nr:serine/threonine-protein kinase PknK [Anaerolineae bacterium]
CTALHVAHQAGVIHRDLKPANILLDDEGNAYLADFGIAKQIGSTNGHSVDKTLEGAVIGSPAYISPEQILAEPVKPQTDIYSLGVMLFELLTGQKPFKGPTPFAYIQQHLNESLPLLAEVDTQPAKRPANGETATKPVIPSALDIVIGRATAKEARERYADILSMLVDLRHALTPGSTAATLATSKSQTEEARHVATMLELPDLENPYKGLRPFSEADAANFFGRETLIQELLARLAASTDLSRFMAVVGPSGSGKSSVVRAGLIPALRQGGLPGSEQWFITEMLPGRHPFEEMEAALLRIAINAPDNLLAQLSNGERGLLRAVNQILPADRDIELLLLIDQFEEAFTLVESEEIRTQFLACLVTAVLDPGSRLRLVITLRADFTDQPLRYIDFGDLVRQRTEFVLPLTPDELEQAIVNPIEQVGLSLESGLAQTIIHEIGDQPGTLPLLQYALTELFERREGRLLTLAAYQMSGGVLGALTRRADELYDSLNAAGQAMTRQLFLRLITLGEGAEDTRRRVLRSELISLDQAVGSERNDTGENDAPAAFNATEPEQNSQPLISLVIDQFARYRLLTFDHD